MTLIIETGANVAGAEAYADATAFDAWAVKMYGAALTGTATDKEAAIRRAMRYLDALDWYGTKVYGRYQALNWPRVGVTDADGWTILSNTIPPEVIEAQHMLARAELTTSGTLSPTIILAGQKTLSAVDSLQWDVARTPNTVEANRAVVTAALDRLKGLIITGSTKQLARA